MIKDFPNGANVLEDKILHSEIERLLEKTRTYEKSKEYADFFDVLVFIKQSRYLAPYNAFLVMQQRSDATLVLSEKRWEEYKRKLREGVQPIVIMKNFGPVEFVYDIKDLEGIDEFPIPGYEPNLPTEELCRRLFPVEGYVDGLKYLYEEMVRSSRNRGLVLVDKPLEVALAGQVGLKPKPLRTSPKDLKTSGRLSNYVMYLNQNHPVEIRFASLVHELAHIFCGHLNEFDNPNFIVKETHEEEFEAEAVSYLFCYRYGFRPRSEQYLAGYLLKGIDPSLKSFDVILSALKKIEDLIKTEPIVGKPVVFEVSIGGYFGPSYNLQWDGSTLDYEEYGDHNGFVRKSALTPTDKEWKRFWLACDRAALWRWKKSYDNPDIVDGTNWSIHIKILHREIKSRGSNAFPAEENQADCGDYPRPFRIFLRAVKKLIGGLSFE